MTPLAKLTDHIRWYSRLDVKHARQELMIVERADVMLCVKAGSFDSFLRVHAKLNHIQQHLQQTLVLIVAARCAEHHEGLAVFQYQCRCQSNSGTFAWRDHVRTIWISQGRLQTLTHQDTCIAGNYCRQPGAAGRGAEQVAVLVNYVNASR